MIKNNNVEEIRCKFEKDTLEEAKDYALLNCC